MPKSKVKFGYCPLLTPADVETALKAVLAPVLASRSPDVVHCAKGSGTEQVTSSRLNVSSAARARDLTAIGSGVPRTGDAIYRIFSHHVVTQEESGPNLA